MKATAAIFLLLSVYLFGISYAAFSAAQKSMHYDQALQAGMVKRLSAEKMATGQTTASIIPEVRVDEECPSMDGDDDDDSSRKHTAIAKRFSAVLSAFHSSFFLRFIKTSSPRCKPLCCTSDCIYIEQRVLRI